MASFTIRQGARVELVLTVVCFYLLHFFNDKILCYFYFWQAVK